MKTRRNSFIIGTALMLLSTATMATTPASGPEKNNDSKIITSVYPIKNTLKLRVAYQVAESTDSLVKIEIFSEDLQLIFKEVVKADEVKRNYDLSTFGEGTYLVKITKGNVEDVHEVTLGETMKENDSFEVFLSPTIENGRVRIAAVSATNGLKLRIRNASGNIIWEKSFDKSHLNQMVNVSNLAKGDYIVEVASSKDSFSRAYSIN